jgi:hypothetical protein
MVVRKYQRVYGANTMGAQRRAQDRSVSTTVHEHGALSAPHQHCIALPDVKETDFETLRPRRADGEQEHRAQDGAYHAPSGPRRAWQRPERPQ